MKNKRRAITIICAIDAFFIFFAIGFNSKQALVVDPSLPPVKVENGAAAAQTSGEGTPSPGPVVAPAAKDVGKQNVPAKRKPKRKATKEAPKAVQ